MVLKNLQDMDNLPSPSSHRVQTPNLSKSRRHCGLSTVSTSSISETATPYHRLGIRNNVRLTKLQRISSNYYITS